MIGAKKLAAVGVGPSDSIFSKVQISDVTLLLSKLPKCISEIVLPGHWEILYGGGKCKKRMTVGLAPWVGGWPCEFDDLTSEVRDNYGPHEGPKKGRCKRPVSQTREKWRRGVKGSRGSRSSVVMIRVWICNLGWCLFPSKVASDTPFLSYLWTDLSGIWYTFD